MQINNQENIIDFYPNSEWASQYKLSEHLEKTWDIPICFNDFLKYHRSFSICGLSVGFKLLQCLIENHKNVLPLGKVNIKGAFLGKGIRDSFEYIFKNSEDNHIKYDPDLKINLKYAQASQGFYGYIFEFDSLKIETSIKPSVVTSDFVKSAVMFKNNKLEKKDFRLKQLMFCKKIIPINSSNICNINFL